MVATRSSRRTQSHSSVIEGRWIFANLLHGKLATDYLNCGKEVGRAFVLRGRGGGGSLSPAGSEISFFHKLKFCGSPEILCQLGPWLRLERLIKPKGCQTNLGNLGITHRRKISKGRVPSQTPDEFKCAQECSNSIRFNSAFRPTRTK